MLPAKSILSIFACFKNLLWSFLLGAFGSEETHFELHVVTVDPALLRSRARFL